MARRGVRGGLFAAAAVLYLVLVGMTASFTGIRLIEDGVTLGGLLAIAPQFFAGYLLARPRAVDDRTPPRGGGGSRDRGRRLRCVHRGLGARLRVDRARARRQRLHQRQRR